MYIQWVPGLLALPTVLVLTGALLAGIVEASVGQGHRLPPISALLCSKSSASAPRTAVSQGVNRDRARQQEGFVFAHCFCQVCCQRGLCSHPFHPQG